jgi:hypothetical protein
MRVKQNSDIGVVVDYAPTNLKQILLLFDTVSFVDPEAKIKQLLARSKINERGDEYRSLANDIEFLMSKNLVYQTSADKWHIKEFVESLPAEETSNEMELIDTLEKRKARKREATLKEFVRLKGQGKKHAAGDLQKIANRLNETMALDGALEFLISRILTKKIQFEGYSAITISNEFDALFADEGVPSGMSNVVEVVLDKIPLPSDQTPWETILDFREDRKTKELLNGLRVWMVEATKSDGSRKELDQKLEWLLFQQTEHLRIHRLTSRMGVMGSVFVGGMEMMEDAIKLRLGRIAKSLVSVSTRRAELLKSELSSPAKELSYLLAVQKRFKE